MAKSKHRRKGKVRPRYSLEMEANHQIAAEEVPGRAPAMLFQRGLLDHRAGRLLQAQAAYRQILTIDPAHADAHNNLGGALSALGRPAEAEASCREALRLRPNYPEIHNNLGNALNALGRPAEAEASCREALRVRPNYPEAHN